MKYKFLDELKSDVIYEAYGKTLKEVFENAAEAMFSVICETKNVKPEESEKYEFKADTTGDLMINWLQGLIAVVDVEQKFYSKFDIYEIDEKHLKAKILGETIRPELGGTVVKAVTMHRYKFEHIKEGYKVTVSLDI